jgi:hypothetical protein
MPGDAVAAAAVSPPFPPQKSHPGWTSSPELEAMVKKFATKAPFTNMGIALADLTLRTRNLELANWIDYAGVNDDKELFAASLVKIAALFAAYRLRERVREAAKSLGAAGGSDPLPRIEAAWKPKVANAIAGRPPDFPKLDKIFSVSGPAGAWTIDFSDTGTPWADMEKLHAKGVPNLGSLGFRDRMNLMISESDNRAAGSCIRDIGFQYLNGALAAEGLYDSGNSRGLFLGGGYDGGTVWGREKVVNTAQGATASAVAHMLVLLETDRLVDAQASHEMRWIMAHAGSFFGEGLMQAKPARTASKIYAKVGRNDPNFDDGAVIERVVNGKLIRYAAVGLNASSRKMLHDLIIQLDDCIVANN